MAGAWRTISVEYEAGVYRISADSLASCSVDLSCDHVYLSPHSSADPEQITEFFCGPVVMLWLAEKGVFCLHSSALSIAGKAVLLMGESGRGKSTLARALTPHYGNWLSDDVTPIRWQKDKAIVDPRFPQLKLTTQPVLAPRPLAAFYLLADGDSAEKQPLPPHQQLLQLIRHTVAITLFPPHLQQTHLAHCQKLARNHPLHRLIYPHTPEAIPATGEIVSREA